MMDREAAARVHRDNRSQQETVTGLVHRAKKAERRVEDLEQELADSRLAWELMHHNYKEAVRQRDSARTWAVHLEGEMEAHLNTTAALLRAKWEKIGD